ncbi:MAG TPA: translation initiation factor IF-6 [Methanobacterium sp.]|nr:translation initiation factor IF-6 [Methanobacterium sp.]
MIKRLNLGGNPNLGVSISATENLALIPPNLTPETVNLIEESLEVETLATLISGSSLAGALTCGNSKGFIVSKYAFDREIEAIKDHGVEVERIPDRLTAVGNIALTNDRGAIVNPLLSDKAVELITQVLDVEVIKGSIAQFNIPGAVAVATNKGVLLHPSANESDIELVEKILKAPADVGTVNNGTALVGACTVATTKGVIVSSNTTGPELARIEETFGFLEGYL